MRMTTPEEQDEEVKLMLKGSVCPHCGGSLQLNKISADQVKKLIEEDETLKKATEGVYTKEDCPYYYSLFKGQKVDADLVITCYKNAPDILPCYSNLLTGCNVTVLAKHCIGVSLNVS